MKPILIIQNSDEQDFVRLTKEDLENITIQSYEQGKADATRLTTRPIYPTGVRSPEVPGTIKWNYKSGDSYGG